MGRQGQGDQAMIPVPYSLYFLVFAAGFFFGLAAGFLRPLPPSANCEGMTGRPEDEDLATPAPRWAGETMLTLRKRGDRAELELARMKKGEEK